MGLFWKHLWLVLLKELFSLLNGFFIYVRYELSIHEIVHFENFLFHLKKKNRKKRNDKNEKKREKQILEKEKGQKKEEKKRKEKNKK